LCLFSSHVYAQDADAPVPTEIQVTPPVANPTKNNDEPVTVDADEFDGYSEKEISARGNVKVRKGNREITSDEAHYDVKSEQVSAKGHVRIEQQGDSIEGAELEFNLQSETGYLDKPSFLINQRHGRGEAEKILFEGDNHYRVTKTTYTTCPAGKDDWYLKVRDMELDKTRQVGTAHDATIVFKNVPILYSPWIDFPLNNQRKTGFLIPSFGSTAKSGIETTIPYYWNIAPNRDATFSPRIMTKRGIQLGSQFRYLDTYYFGELNWDNLPDDRVTHTDRYGISYKHFQNFGGNWTGNINYQKVSDDTYFTDLADRISATSQTNLPHEGWLAYNVDRFNFTSRIQRFQTLQDPFAPVVPPYDRVPQLTLSASRSVSNAELVLNSELVRFEHPTLVKGDRFILYPNVSYPIYSAYGYLTPKVGLHFTRYSLDHTTTSLPDQSRSVPIFSLESGITYERDWQFRGEKFIQTLEPKAYYVYIPYRNQNNLPNFDSAIADFNFAQIFTENQFSGGDRINDANQVTLALTSRLLDRTRGKKD
jgi:LPS-assembly protein